MKQEDLNKVFDSIEPDAYLKTRLEAKVNSADKKRKSIKKPIIATISTVLCLLVLFSIGRIDLAKNNNIVNNDNSSSFVMVAYAKEGVIGERTLQLGVETPIDYKLKAYDIRNKSESEIEALKEQLRQENQTVREEETAFEIKAKTESLENILLQRIVKNAFVLDIEDPSDVKSIELKTNTDYWYLNYCDRRDNVDIEKRFPKGQELIIDGDTFVELVKANINSGYDMFCINLEHDMKLCSTIDDNPNVDMSMFDDTLTFTVEYKDGKIEQSKINISLNQDGTLTIKLI